jgi:hypothetical protein
LAALLSVAMAASLFVATPTKAFAATANQTTADTCEYFLGGVSQGTASLNNALSMMTSGSGNSIIMLEDITLNASGSWYITNSKSFDFYNNSNTLNFNSCAINIYSGCNVHIHECGDIVGLGAILVDCYTPTTSASTVVLDGDLTLSSGISASKQYSGSVVTLNGNLTTLSTLYIAIDAEKSANVTVNGSIKSSWKGVCAESSASVTVNGNIEAADEGVDDWSGGIVTVNGNLTAGAGHYGVYAGGTDTYVKVTGDINSGAQAVTAFSGFMEESITYYFNLSLSKYP